MAQRDQVLGMFGASPEQIMARRRREQAQEVLRTQDPFQRAGGAIGMGLARMFGGEPEEVTRQRRLQQALQGVDMTNPEQMTQAASMLNQAGFSNEAMQLLSRADQFRTSAMDRERSQAAIDLSTQQVEASKADVTRGQFETYKETISFTDPETGLVVPVQVTQRRNRDDGTVTTVTTSEDQATQAKGIAQKLSRETDADARQKIIDEAKLENARTEGKFRQAQLTEQEKKAGIVQGYVRFPIERQEVDPVTKQVKLVSGFEYKAVDGRMVENEEGVKEFQPVGPIPPQAEMVDEKTGVPSNYTEFNENEKVRLTVGGVETVEINGEFFKAHRMDGKIYYDPTSEPVDPDRLRKEQQESAPAVVTTGPKGQMNRASTVTPQPVFSSPKRTVRNR